MFLSIFGIVILLSTFMLVSAWLFDQFNEEAANEAAIVSETLGELGWSVSDEPDAVNVLLRAMKTGAVGPNLLSAPVNILASAGEAFANISSISIVDPSLTIIASSDEAFVGQPVDVLPAEARGVVELALSGEDDFGKLSAQHAGDDPGLLGAYPLVLSGTGEGNAGPTRYAIVVDKSQQTLPDTALGAIALALSYVASIGATIAVLVGLPAIPTATIVGINRARSIAKPANDLARAAERLAAGDRSVRVWVPGNDEIARLARAFNRMADQLQLSLHEEAAARAQAERLLAANRDLVANVSHELRTPVALIRGHLEALADDPAHLEAYSEIALRETDRLEDLVDDLFQLARVEAQGIEFEQAPFDAAGAVREAVESLAGPAKRDAGITMRAEVIGPPTGYTVIGDRERLVQVIQNLLRNAVRHTPEGGIILSTVQPDPATGDVLISVRDTGEGIPEEDLERIFERFFRSDKSRSRAGGGAGLGLAIAKQFVEAMGGTIFVESTVGEGTVFTIRLPMAASERERLSA